MLSPTNFGAAYNNVNTQVAGLGDFQLRRYGEQRFFASDLIYGGQRLLPIGFKRLAHYPLGSSSSS